MDARKLGIKAIKEAIQEQAYELTGITENGEVILAIVCDSESLLINKLLRNGKTEMEKSRNIKKLMQVRGRDAEEYMQIYLQRIVEDDKVCKANGLRFK